MEPISRSVRPISMDEFAEDLPGPALPAAVEAYFASERSWWRTLRVTGAVTPEETREKLMRWLEQ